MENVTAVLQKNLTLLRRRAGLTQEQFAEKLGLSFQAVSKWENGLSCPDIALLPLQSPHDLREVRGPLEKLLSPEVAAAGNPEDYLHVTLTDSEPVADPMQRLRQVYPNVMRLDFAALAPEAEEGELSAEEAAVRSPEELFNSFYEQMQGVKLSPEEAMLVRLTMDEIWGEPEGGQV